MMKNHIALSFLIGFIVWAGRVQSQEYTPFPTENMQWTSMKVNPNFGIPDDDLIYWRIYTNGDTLINDKTYTSLKFKWECWVRHDFNNNVSYINTFPNSLYPHDNYLMGAIREEDKRVYFYPYQLDWLSTGGVHGLAPHQDHLLYDFNALAGDTVHFSTTQWIEQVNGNPVIHTEEHFTLINSLPGNGSFNVSPSDSWSFPAITGLWTEGVGSSFGLMGSYDSFLSSLVCYGPIEPTTCTPCQSAVAVNEPLNDADVEVFPNPASSELLVRNKGKHHIHRIQLFDSQGRLVSESVSQNNDNQFVVNISNLPDAFYLLNVSFEGGDYLNRKIIKN